MKFHEISLQEISIQDFSPSIVRGGLRDLVYETRSSRDFRWRDVEADVETVKEFLRTKIGHNWAQATRYNLVPHVLETGLSRARPWKEIEAKMRERGRKAPHNFVREVVNRYTSFFEWQP